MLNGSPRKVEEFNQASIKVVDGAPVYLGDIARVSDSTAVATDIVRVNGDLATYRLILKHTAASTLTVVDQVKQAIGPMSAFAPKGTDIKLAFDQSVFVREALLDVLEEGALAAALVGLMVLVFLGSWRSTVIVVTSIPLAIFTSIIGLKLSGQTINLMTLGGLALAIGMLVDDATVEVENIHRNHMMGKAMERGDPRWRAANRGSRVRRHPRHLHRVLAGGRLVRRCAAICLRRWRSRWCMRCSPRTCSRARWCRAWRASFSTIFGAGTRSADGSGASPRNSRKGFARCERYGARWRR